MNKKIVGILMLTGLSVGLVGCVDDSISSNSSSSSSSSNPSTIINTSSDDWDAGDGWTLEWSDEFNGSSIDSSIWTHETGYGNNGWGNDEWQYYTSDEENSSVANGYLTITAMSDETAGKRNGSVTSARMVTLDNNIDFKYGKVAAKIKVPTGQGIWPAFWMLGTNINSVGWPNCGEIDIMEKVGGTDEKEQTVHGTIHYSDADGAYDYDGDGVELNEYLSYDYHVYEIEWSESAIIWKVDGEQYHSVDISNSQYDEFKEDFFIILNVAVGGNWPGSPDSTTIFPQEMSVDWVRVYK